MHSLAQKRSAHTKGRCRLRCRSAPVKVKWNDRYATNWVLHWLGFRLWPKLLWWRTLSLNNIWRLSQLYDKTIQINYLAKKNNILIAFICDNFFHSIISFTNYKNLSLKSSCPSLSPITKCPVTKTFETWYGFSWSWSRTADHEHEKSWTIFCLKAF